MAVKIQVRRGSRAGLPALAPGEYGLTTDTKELFIGGPDGNLQVPVLGSDGKIPTGQLPDMDYDPAGSAAAVQTNLTSHTNNKSNPHGVTAAQVGAVPTSRTVNGKALSADISLTAADVGADAAGAASGVQTSLTSHTNNKSNPHGVTAAQVGALPTSGGTMTGSIKMGEHDITGTATNYGLFFDSMGQVIVKAGDSNSVEVTDMGVTIRSDVGITLDGSVSGISKSSVGLGNVDNTSDANKPISTATQNALNGKQATVTGGASTITSSNLTANRALVSNGSGKVAVSAVTSTELGYLDGVTSNIQTQINAKASTSYVDGLVGDINSALDAINGEVI